MSPGALLAASLLAPGGLPGAPDPDFLLCVAAREQGAIESRVRVWEYTKDDVRIKLDGGKEIERSVVTRRIHRTRPDGVPVNEAIARDGRPLAGEEATAARLKRDNRFGELAPGSAELRRQVENKTREAWEKVQVTFAVDEAYRFRLEGFEHIGEVPCWVVSFYPRPDFRPRTKEQGYLPRFAGVAWVAVAERPYLRRLELDFIRSVSVKWGPFATLTPGSHLLLLNGEAEPGLPVTLEVELDLKLRILFLFGRYERRGTYYREHSRVNPLYPIFEP